MTHAIFQVWLVCGSVYLRYSVCIHTDRQTDKDHVQHIGVGLAQASPN